MTSDLQFAQQSFDINPMSVPVSPTLMDELLVAELNRIPDKMGFKIGEVADLLGVKTYVLRFWETEFDQLKPKKADNKQRYYTRKEVESAFLIRKLLYRDRFSIEGAKAAIKGLKQEVKAEVRRDHIFNSLKEKLELAFELNDEVSASILRCRKLLK